MLTSAVADADAQVCYYRYLRFLPSGKFYYRVGSPPPHYDPYPTNCVAVCQLHSVVPFRNNGSRATCVVVSRF